MKGTACVAVLVEGTARGEAPHPTLPHSIFGGTRVYPSSTWGEGDAPLAHMRLPCPQGGGREGVATLAARANRRERCARPATPTPTLPLSGGGRRLTAI